MNQFCKIADFREVLVMFSDDQLAIIAEAVEDYAVLVDEDSADKCSEILDIIEAHFINKKYRM